MEVKNISVNGLPLIHHVGDYPYTIEFGEDDNDNFTPTVSTVPRSIDSVRIRKNKIDWLDDEGYILATTNNEYGTTNNLFWSREEAERFLKEYFPKNRTFTKVTEVFILDNGRIEKTYINRMNVVDNTIGYNDNHWRFYTEDDIGKKVFLTYEEAKKVRDEDEAREFLNK